MYQKLRARVSLCRWQSLFFILGWLLLSDAAFGSGMEMRESSAVNLFARSTDGESILRFSCLDGESLFISLIVPDGSVRAPAITATVPEAKATFRWLAWYPGHSNIIYAVRPKELVRTLLRGHDRRIIFSNPAPGTAGPVFGPFGNGGRQHCCLPVASEKMRKILRG
ncbi:hypothetical protein O3W44_21585 [Pantoea sp. LMR881]|uniref:hypothetical protein n=1 Tax=Pantoea sp. LMR881 TaxID=3014336 RepID=UPI0022AF7562|nr:hypothetical protein [Pantoea sp. LMR881]MCZ4061130.1 hypothetical protein [Pantoea sp. LMR881]